MIIGRQLEGCRLSSCQLPSLNTLLTFIYKYKYVEDIVEAVPPYGEEHQDLKG